MIILKYPNTLRCLRKHFKKPFITTLFSLLDWTRVTDSPSIFFPVDILLIVEECNGDDVMMSQCKKYFLKGVFYFLQYHKHR